MRVIDIFIYLATVVICIYLQLSYFNQFYYFLVLLTICCIIVDYRVEKIYHHEKKNYLKTLFALISVAGLSLAAIIFGFHTDIADKTDSNKQNEDPLRWLKLTEILAYPIDNINYRHYLPQEVIKFESSNNTNTVQIIIVDATKYQADNIENILNYTNIDKYETSSINSVAHINPDLPTLKDKTALFVLSKLIELGMRDYKSKELTDRRLACVLYYFGNENIVPVFDGYAIKISDINMNFNAYIDAVKRIYRQNAINSGRTNFAEVIQYLNGDLKKYVPFRDNNAKIILTLISDFVHERKNINNTPDTIITFQDVQQQVTELMKIENLERINAVRISSLSEPFFNNKFINTFPLFALDNRITGKTIEQVDFSEQNFENIQSQLETLNYLDQTSESEKVTFYTPYNNEITDEAVEAILKFEGLSADNEFTIGLTNNKKASLEDKNIYFKLSGCNTKSNLTVGLNTSLRLQYNGDTCFRCGIYPEDYVKKEKLYLKIQSSRYGKKRVYVVDCKERLSNSSSTILLVFHSVLVVSCILLLLLPLSHIAVKKYFHKRIYRYWRIANAIHIAIATNLIYYFLYLLKEIKEINFSTYYLPVIICFVIILVISVLYIRNLNRDKSKIDDQNAPLTE